MSPERRREEVLIAVGQALLGEVTPSLRAVTVRYDESSLTVDAYYQDEPTDTDREALSMVETELLAHFPDDHKITVELHHLPAPQLVPKDRPWVYHRRED